MQSEVHLIEHAQREHAKLTNQIAALERITSDKQSHLGERFWAVRTALKSADTLQDLLCSLHDRYCDPKMGGAA